MLTYDGTSMLALSIPDSERVKDRLLDCAVVSTLARPDVDVYPGEDKDRYGCPECKQEGPKWSTYLISIVAAVVVGGATGVVLTVLVARR